VVKHPPHTLKVFNNLAPESFLVAVYLFWGDQKRTQNSRCRGIIDTYSCIMGNCSLVFDLCSSPDNSLHSHLVNWAQSWHFSGTNHHCSTIVTLYLSSIYRHSQILYSTVLKH